MDAGRRRADATRIHRPRRKVKFLLDTDAFSVASRDGSPTLRERMAETPAADIGLSAITVGEIEFGLAKQTPPERIVRRIAALRSSFTVLPVGESVGLVYGRLRQQLRSQGTPIGPNDLWLAAQAMASGL